MAGTPSRAVDGRPHRPPHRRHPRAHPGTWALHPKAAPHSAGGGAAAEVPAPVVHISDRTPRLSRDGAVRHAHAPRIDAQNRVNLGEALGALGWTPQTLLVASRENGHVVIRAAADSPLLTRVPVDVHRRLTLPPAVLVALGYGAVPTRRRRDRPTGRRHRLNRELSRVGEIPRRGIGLTAVQGRRAATHPSSAGFGCRSVEQREAEETVMSDPTTRPGRHTGQTDAAAPGHHHHDPGHGPTHGQGLPVAPGDSHLGVEDPLRAVAGSAPDGHGDRAVHGGHEDHGGRGDHGGHAAHGGHAGHGGHGGHGGHHVAMFRRLFWIMLALAVPTVLFSGMFADIVGYPLPDVPGLTWVSPVLGTVIFVWGGLPFLTGAVGEIRTRRPGMMLLIGMAITVAFIASWGATVGSLSHELDFWWELALLIVIMLLGHWLEMRSLAQTSSALDSLAALLPDEAEKVVGDQVVTVPPAELAVGDVVVIRPGGRVPADGEVIEGTADVDESMITGESKPVRRGVGDTVVAGTVATDTAIRVRVTAVGDDTALAGIQRLVAEAQSSTTRAQLLADRAAGWLFWFAVAAAGITAVVWSLYGAPDSALVRVITVLVIACPHALGLAIPLVVSISTERAARGGVLVKDRGAMERMRTVDTVLFDKTGTLTKGEPAVNHIAGVGRTEDEVLALAAAAETDSEHPLARAIVAAARQRNLPVSPATEFRASAAVGVTATVEGHTVAVGGPHMLTEHGLTPLPDTRAWAEEGATVLHVLVDGHVVGALALADEIRPASREAVAALHALGIDVVMITGDAEPVARAVAAELGIDQVFAGVRPEDKAEKVAALQQQGRAVAMVGDGVNDAPSLARADVGLAIGAGTDVAIGSAGIILASSDPRAVVSVIRLSRASYRKMQENLWAGAGYNLIAVPLAAGVLAPIGFVLPMEVGALLMSLSTVVVASNAQLLRRLDLRPEASVAEVTTGPAAPARRSGAAAEPTAAGRH
ncbi:heavy metal translocating P-type ATPase [Blastococcus sp. SYSU DS0616]